MEQKRIEFCMKNFKNFLFILIIFIAAFLRFNNLANNPPSIDWDEAAWGYNAYSLSIDGRDEFGRFLPHDYLESFGDFKAPMYSYLDIIPVKILGLNEFSARFPSALFGTLTVFLTFFLVQRIFYTSKNKEIIALFSALFLAISPWHIMLSRALFVANVASFFIVFGVWAFLAAIENKKWYLLISAVSFALSMYTFNTARVVSPILIVVLSVVFWDKLWRIKKQVILSAVLGLLVFLPTFKFLLTPQAALRFKEVNIFSDITVIKISNQEIAMDQNAIWSKIIHNRRVLFSLEYIKHYLDNLSPIFLFIKGDVNPKFSIQDVGQMYLWDLPFFVYGALYLFRKREGNWKAIPLWLLIGIIPAATARETPHALRIETTLPTFQILTAYGFVAFTDRISKYKRLIFYILIFILFLNFFYFYYEYSVHYPIEYSGQWNYGYKQSAQYALSVEKKYDYIEVTSAQGSSYIYQLFFGKTNPKLFRQTAKVQRDVFGFVTIESYGKFIFSKKLDTSLSKNKKVLYIDLPDNMPKNGKLLKTFYLLNGKKALIAYTI
jgi:4-amino-4-deoxy-L-arabinose transferase-like glycosyltransferase